MRKNKIKKWSVLSIVGVYVPLILFAFLCIVPFIMVISTSFSQSKLIEEFGCTIFPKGFSLDAYKTIFIYPDEIIQAYGNSILITVVGTLLNVFLTITVAYPISKLDFKFRSLITFSMFLTTSFGAGLVPLFIWYQKFLHIYKYLVGIDTAQCRKRWTYNLFKGVLSGDRRRVLRGRENRGCKRIYNDV